MILSLSSMATSLCTDQNVPSSIPCSVLAFSSKSPYALQLTEELSLLIDSFPHFNLIAVGGIFLQKSVGSTANWSLEPTNPPLTSLPLVRRQRWKIIQPICRWRVLCTSSLLGLFFSGVLFHWRRWKNFIRINLKYIGINTRNWVESAPGRDYWRALVNATLNRQYRHNRTMKDESKCIKFFVYKVYLKV